MSLDFQLQQQLDVRKAQSLYRMRRTASSPQGVELEVDGQHYLSLVKVAGTPLDEMESLEALEPLEFVRTIAVARILMPVSWVRLSAGRESMREELQALCFAAGANSMFSGEQLLTTPNAGEESDASLFAKLGLEALAGEEVVLG
ncbi:MAG TPA: hypothetical protein HPP91_15285 [Gammaproteobacteria bacterium]|nr:hypothetical protein [Gammaproteobacteria bacterium]